MDGTVVSASMAPPQPPKVKKEKSLKKQLKPMDRALEKTIETVWRCSVIVEEGINVQDAPAQKELMFNQINEFLQDLRTLEAEARKLPPTIVVDENVVRKIDEGINPDLITQEKLIEAHQKNAFTRGKLFSTKVYADQLTAKLQYHRQLGTDRIGMENSSSSCSPSSVSSSLSSTTSSSSSLPSCASSMTDSGP